MALAPVSCEAFGVEGKGAPGQGEDTASGSSGSAGSWGAPGLGLWRGAAAPGCLSTVCSVALQSVRVVFRGRGGVPSGL